MGVFGAPTTYGDDPERAVRAALAVRDWAEEDNVQVRIAVNTGEAIVELDARPDHGEAMVAGDVVNTAARLQSAAPAGSVIVGEETYVATRNVIEYRPAQPVLAKGKSAPVRAWLAVRATSQIGERPTTQVPMVGRERELGVLTGIWDRVIEEGRAQLATVFGPAGIGKSRLGIELATLVADQGPRSSRSRDAVRGERALQRLRPARQADGDDLRQRRARRSAGKARCSDRTARRPSGCRGARTAPRSAPRHRQRGNGRGSRDALLFGTSLRRVAGDGRPDACSCSRTSTGPTRASSTSRDARVTRARRAGHVRGARAPGARLASGRPGVEVSRRIRRSSSIRSATSRARSSPSGSLPARAVAQGASRVAELGRGKSALHRRARRVDRGTLDLGRLADECPGDHRRPSRLPSSRRASAVLVDASVAGRSLLERSTHGDGAARGPRGKPQRSRGPRPDRTRGRFSNQGRPAVRLQARADPRRRVSDPPRAARRERHAAVARFLSAATAEPASHTRL